jgi:glycine/D-amino acid oxidase-like deaminating enzyme
MDERSDEGFADSLKRKLVQRFPSCKWHSGSAWVGGDVTITPDWHPIVGKAPGTDGYYLAVGGSGHSFKIGPPICESLAALIAGKKPSIDISACDTRDFKRTKRLIQFGARKSRIAIVHRMTWGVLRFKSGYARHRTRRNPCHL